MRWREAGWIGAAVLLVGALPVAGWCDRPLPFYDSKDLSPYWVAEKQGKHPALVEAFQVTDQEGRAVSEKDLSGKISVVNFFFDQCGSLCPLMMSSIQKFQKELRSSDPAAPVRIFSFSVMPEHDTPSELKQYARARGMDLSNWRLLTGSRREIYRIGEGMFQADRSPGSTSNEASFIHSSSVYLVDTKLRIRGIYDAQSPKEMAYLRQDIAKLQSDVER